MDNSTGRSMSMLAFYNNFILDQLLYFIREVQGFINTVVDPSADIKKRKWGSLPIKY